jgi:hypothetical protein
MIELASLENNKSSPDTDRVKPLSAVIFIGLLNSFDHTHALLKKLRKKGSTDILEIKDDMIKLRNRTFQIFLRINSILDSYKDEFRIENNSNDCDFCPDVARIYKDFHVWCECCYEKEYGGNI